MRISDWSSDVCSSDLLGLDRKPPPDLLYEFRGRRCARIKATVRSPRRRAVCICHVRTSPCGSIARLANIAPMTGSRQQELYQLVRPSSSCNLDDDLAEMRRRADIPISAGCVVEGRTEESRVGEEGVITVNSWWP